MNKFFRSKQLIIKIIRCNLDTVCRVLLDRQWSVGESVGAILRFIRITLSHPNPQDVPSLFEQIIGCEERMLHSNSSSVSSDSCLDS
ncbi:hypothetical protein LSTR_LSTR013030 [Laodelphax striatellus]|uniref:Uncharacterized protein n=1 Tax=Laodelphax striatellus TaxID=195883 RepID=A0A482WNE3_LAOST|nr:hypothetical protein LSTR_LSTR013030 [Laodelphax striatellus]